MYAAEACDSACIIADHAIIRDSAGIWLVGHVIGPP